MIELILVFIIVLILILLGLVVIPSVTVSVDKEQYLRGEDVLITTTLSGTDISGKTVNSIIHPPSGDDYIGPSGTTDTSGVCSLAWAVPVDAVEGTYTVTISVSGLTATATFIRVIGIVDDHKKQRYRSE